ncbi:hypothetical protein RRG08_040381 [Elysia crispata]|uniref:Uncharacterized protein n=1 Tax=Elysia crispata TaxID=231223 RepID=A0AAE1A2G8_9GAST|nr:hypothetical protein RRG08_040381 [Elysia crispata]
MFKAKVACHTARLKSENWGSPEKSGLARFYNEEIQQQNEIQAPLSFFSSINQKAASSLTPKATRILCHECLFDEAGVPSVEHLGSVQHVLDKPAKSVQLLTLTFSLPPSKSDGYGLTWTTLWRVSSTVNTPYRTGTKQHLTGQGKSTSINSTGPATLGTRACFM